MSWLLACQHTKAPITHSICLTTPMLKPATFSFRGGSWPSPVVMEALPCTCPWRLPRLRTGLPPLPVHLLVIKSLLGVHVVLCGSMWVLSTATMPKPVPCCQNGSPSQTVKVFSSRVVLSELPTHSMTLEVWLSAIARL